MNAYRIALILCRAVAVALWWSAGLRFVSAFVMVVAGLFGVFGQGLPLAPLSVQTLVSVVPVIVVAAFLQIFASSLAASMTGGATFSGDSIAAKRTLDASEKALGNAGAGLFLLCFGLTIAIPSTINVVYIVLTGQLGTGTTIKTVAIYSLMTNELPAILQCLVGFVLAFRLGLRRLAKTQ